MPNSISEWFGHRVYPTVRASAKAQADQKRGLCPFLGSAVGKGGAVTCIKPSNSRGVCTVSSNSNGFQQDWVVCPYRTIDSPIFAHSTQRLFRLHANQPFHLIPAPALAEEKTRTDVQRQLANGHAVFIYFIDKLGGEIDLPGSARSPKFKLDTTIVELRQESASTLNLARYAVVEVQTMDFHGSYKHATTSLVHALQLHPKDFPKQLHAHPEWAAEEIEGPNISNVFKRTIYQVLFKLRFGHQPDCAGCILALPKAVWDSWQPHLGAPKLEQLADGTWQIAGSTNADIHSKQPGWIYLFDIDAKSELSPNPISVTHEIRIESETLSKLAFTVAPELAMEHIGGDAGLKAIIQRRMATFWPEAFQQV
jgi:hypothetical protein